MSNGPGPDHGDEPFRASEVERLVGDIDLDPFLGTPVDPLAEPLEQPVPVEAETPTLLVLRDLLVDERFPELFARALRAADPDFRELFPRDATPVLQIGRAHV